MNDLGYMIKTLNDSHSEIIEYVKQKISDEEKIHKENISVNIDRSYRNGSIDIRATFLTVVYGVEDISVMISIKYNANNKIIDQYCGHLCSFVLCRCV